MRSSCPLLAVLLLAALPVACGGTKNAGPSDGALPEGTRRDGKLYPDLGQLPDLGQKVPCDSEWRDAIRPQSKVTTGAVTTTELVGGVKQTQVDATAGGMSLATQNPWVYVSLAGGARVDVDDLAARASTAWDLAFRRAVIRVNGGDSGPGQGAIAVLAAKTLDEVIAAPATGAFAADDFLDDKCQIKRNAIGDLWTAIGGVTGLWYDYDAGTSQLTPNKAVYVVRLAKGGHVKLVIDSYYKNGTGAIYTLRWSTL